MARSFDELDFDDQRSDRDGARKGAYLRRKKRVRRVATKARQVPLTDDLDDFDDFSATGFDDELAHYRRYVDSDE